LSITTITAAIITSSAKSASYWHIATSDASAIGLDMPGLYWFDRLTKEGFTKVIRSPLLSKELTAVNSWMVRCVYGVSSIFVWRSLTPAAPLASPPSLDL